MVIRNYAMHNPLKLAQRCFLKKGQKYLKMYFSVPKLLLILLIQHFILYLPLFMPISMMFFNDVLTSCGICMYFMHNPFCFIRLHIKCRLDK